MTGAALTGALLTGAALTGAPLTGAPLTDAALTGHGPACYLSCRQAPPGPSPPRSGNRPRLGMAVPVHRPANCLDSVTAAEARHGAS
ncbi:MAG: pentapeptide repeat-containing protein [Streptosporangiaceae bacterium]